MYELVSSKQVMTNYVTPDHEGRKCVRLAAKSGKEDVLKSIVSIVSLMMDVLKNSQRM
jgi:hypothetical protein